MTETEKRGLAMLPELVLVAVILSIVGVALYQSNHSVAAIKVKPGPVLVTASAAADLTVKAAQQSAASTAAASATIEGDGDVLTGADTDITTLGGSVDENSF